MINLGGIIMQASKLFEGSREQTLLQIVNSDIEQNLATLTSNIPDPVERDPLDTIARNQLIEGTENLLRCQADNLDACNIEPNDDRRVALTNYINEFMTIIQSYIHTNLQRLRFDTLGTVRLTQEQRDQLIADTNSLLQQLERALTLENAQHMQELQELRDRVENVICINRNFRELESDRLNQEQRYQYIVDTNNLLQQLAEILNQNPTPDNVEQWNELQDKLEVEIHFDIHGYMSILEPEVLNLDKRNQLAISQYSDDIEKLLQVADTLVRDHEELRELIRQSQDGQHQELTEECRDMTHREFRRFQNEFAVIKTINPIISVISYALQLLDDHRQNSSDLPPDDIEKARSVIDDIEKARSVIIDKLRLIASNTRIDIDYPMELGRHMARSFPNILNIFVGGNIFDHFGQLIQTERFEPITETEQRNWRNFYSGIAEVIYISRKKLPDKLPGSGTLRNMADKYNDPTKIVTKGDLEIMIDRLIIAHFGDSNLPFIVEKLIANMNPRGQFAILEDTLRYMQDHINEYGCWGQRVVSRLEILRNQIKRENLVEVPAAEQVNPEVPGPGVEVVAEEAVPGALAEKPVAEQEQQYQ